MSTSHSPHSKKFLMIASLILLVILILAGNQFALANGLMKEQKATQSLSEGAQSELDKYKKLIDKEADPTKKAELEKGLRMQEMRATEISLAQTEAPTNWAIKQTALAEPTQQRTPKPKKLRVYGLQADFTNIYLDRSVDMALGAWSDPEPDRNDQAAIVYFSGVVRKSKYGVVIRFYENPVKIEKFIVAEETGKIKIIDRKGDFLVLKRERGDLLYFNVVTNEFSLSMEGAITPIPTITPSKSTVSPTETLQAYP